MEEKMKSTKKILHEKQSGQPHTPLYSAKALDAIRRSEERWRNTVVREQDRDNWLKSPQTVLGSDTPRELLYTPLSNSDFDYERDLGNSGEAPFTRSASTRACLSFPPPTEVA